MKRKAKWKPKEEGINPVADYILYIREFVSELNNAVIGNHCLCLDEDYDSDIMPIIFKVVKYYGGDFFISIDKVLDDYEKLLSIGLQKKIKPFRGRGMSKNNEKK